MRTANHRAPAGKRPRHLVRIAAVSAGLLAIAALGLPSTARAVVTITAAFPATTQVGGAADPVKITVTGGMAGDFVTQVNILPSCGSAPSLPLATGCGSPDPGVFSLALVSTTCSSPAALSGPTANGMYWVTFNPPQVFAAPGSCDINLTRKTLKLPTVDADAVTTGLQTNAMASQIGSDPDTNSLGTAVTVNPGVPSGGGGGGPDTCGGLPVTIPGGSGNDVIDGTTGDDVINAGSGNDTINGKGGHDVICGGSGNDVINGGGGTGFMFGGSGNDTFNKGGGTYTVDGGSGNDVTNP
jgi:hypothetical protein